MTERLRRFRYPILAVVGALLVAGALLSERSGRSDGRAGRPEPSPTIRLRGRLGPTPGPNAEGYVAEKRAHLDRLAVAGPATPAAALISLSRLATAADAGGLAREGHPDVLFVRAPTASPEAVAVDASIEVAMTTWAQRASSSLEAEAVQLEGLAKTAATAERTEYLRRASAKRAAAGDVRTGCTCVYAVVVGETTVAKLAALRTNALVRLIDVPDPPVPDLRGWELTPLLPAGAA